MDMADIRIWTVVVNGNPAAFKNAYWEINAMHIYAPPPDLLGKS